MLGRVFALRVPIGVVAQSTGIIAAVSLADGVFEPLLVEGGALVGSIGAIIGVGEGRGTGFMHILAGLTLVAFAVVSFIIPPIWRLEDALPDQPSQVESEPGSDQGSSDPASPAFGQAADDVTGR